MANANLPRGLIPSRTIRGSHYEGAGSVYFVPATYATAIYIGDPVVTITNQADANGIPVVNLASAGGGTFITGVMVGVIAAGSPAVPELSTSPTYRPASVAQYILVEDDPATIFEAQMNATIAIGAAGRNVDLISGAGTGANYSGWQLNASTLQTTNTLQIRLLRPVERIDNDPTLTLAKWLCKINLHTQNNLTGI